MTTTAELSVRLGGAISSSMSESLFPPSSSGRRKKKRIKHKA
jgi:hypothetical protein